METGAFANYRHPQASATCTHVGLRAHPSDPKNTTTGCAVKCPLLLYLQVFKFSFYVIFFAVMFTLYGVPPLNLIRDIYMSFDQLQRRLQAFFR